MHSTKKIPTRAILLTLLVAACIASTGCAVLAGGAAGAATGYVAGRAARD
jgi:hypothetical protein